MIRKYSELKRLDTFVDRFKYLSLGGRVGRVTFGFDRYVNQQFYRSHEWKQLRHHIIARDNGCDLGIEGREINGLILVHHMNPLELRDLIHSKEDILDPEFLITTTRNTHNAIHFGDENLLVKLYTPRTRGDTKLW